MSGSILDRIYEARIEQLRKGVEPIAVYLGQCDYNDLWAAARDNGVITAPTLTRDMRTRVFDMPVYAVDQQRYLRVV